ncbi:MAG: class I SAM-dependent methyltransferase [Bacteroidia bacterium]|nr:class I SAM-dependent methyltransferase [Bacteroidia bacterium]
MSKQDFSVWACGDCTHRFTQDVPVESEIGAYYQSEDYISHSNTNRGLINRLYQWVRNYTIGKKVALIQKQSGKPTGSILDVGCGTGEFLAGMKAAGWKVQGLEPDGGAREQASNITATKIGKPEELFTLPETYDVITMWHVLEHVHQLHEYLDRFGELLSPSGVLLVAVPNYTSTDAQYYEQNWAAYDVPRHLYHFSPESMNRVMKLHGFQVEAHLPMPFDAFYVSMLSEQYKHGKSRLISAFFKGLSSWNKARGTVTKGSSVLYVIRRS